MQVSLQSGFPVSINCLNLSRRLRDLCLISTTAPIGTKTRTAIKKRRPELKVLPVELPMARVPVGIVTLKHRTPNPVAKLFIKCAREIAKPLTRK